MDSEARNTEQAIESLRRRLAVQTATTQVLAETTSLEAAVPMLLAEIGRELRWDVGAFWEPQNDSDILRRTAEWHADTAEASAFVLRDRDREFTRGDGIPGGVWASRAPRVIENFADVQNFPRRALAAECNLRSALAFPVQVQDEFFGVLEFFSSQSEHADPDLLSTMAAVGIQLGLFVRRSRTEAARLESESRFRIFAETASDATFTINEASIILYVNPAVERIFGYHPQELLGKSLTTIIPERLRAAHNAGVQRYRTTGRRNIPWSGVELPGLHKLGHEVPLEISFGEYMREGVRYFTGIARDITERVRYQREIEDYAQRLTQLVKELEIRSDEAEAASRAKSQFLANMSHEIRTPINAIIGYGELLQMGVAGALSQNQSEYLERVRISAKHLLGLITDVLDLSKIEAGHFTVNVEVAQIGADIEAALSLVRPQATDKSIVLKNECSAVGSYLGDVARVRQILVNLLSNAVKFTAENGRVSVVCGSAAEAPADAGLSGSGPWVYVSVSDNGIGIEPDQLAGIFRPFVQASTGKTRTHGGTGLGLSISQQLAHLMNGEITAQSEPGQGSTFTLWLPTVSPAREERVTSADGRGSGARQLGLALIRDAQNIVARYVSRIREDPAIPETAAMALPEIADHLSSLIADYGQALTIVGEVGHDFDLLRDSSDIQRLIAERHGEQRARHHWTEEALARDHAILRVVLENFVQERAVASAEHEHALRILMGFLRNAEQISLQSFRDSVAAAAGRDA